MGTVRCRIVCLGLIVVLGAVTAAARADDDKSSKRERPRAGAGDRFGQLLPSDIADKLKLTDEQ
jgi:hypothetical protein